jgi:hypothetical protein
MANIHDRAVIATVRIAIDQKVTATLGPHMAQSHGCQLSNFVRRHASQHPHSGKTSASREATLIPVCADGRRLNDMGQQDYEMGAVKLTIATSIKALEFGFLSAITILNDVCPMTLKLLRSLKSETKSNEH